MSKIKYLVCMDELLSYTVLREDDIYYYLVNNNTKRECQTPKDSKLYNSPDEAWAAYCFYLGEKAETLNKRIKKDNLDLVNTYKKMDEAVLKIKNLNK